MLEGWKQQIVARRKKIMRIMIHQVELSVQPPHRGKISTTNLPQRGRREGYHSGKKAVKKAARLWGWVGKDLELEMEAEGMWLSGRT